ncbi:hypothetical protein MHTCC0001_26080 [Flavobacteriaceae bacterium MHTCC 0001]
MRPKLFLLILFFTFSNVYAQKESLKDINTQVWANFTKSYESLDHVRFASIHSDDLIRVSGDSKKIKNKEEYIDGYKKWWTDNSLKQTISFRFLERIYSENKASERGIYKLTQNPGTEDEKSFYGKFHVILTKENKKWKILMDYDSSESDTIDELSYKNASAIDDFLKY